MNGFDSWIMCVRPLVQKGSQNDYLKALTKICASIYKFYLIKKNYGVFGIADQS